MVETRALWFPSTGKAQTLIFYNSLHRFCRPPATRVPGSRSGMYSGFIQGLYSSLPAVSRLQISPSSPRGESLVLTTVWAQHNTDHGRWHPCRNHKLSTLSNERTPSSPFARHIRKKLNGMPYTATP